MRVTYTQGSRVPKRFFAHVSHLPISPSPFSCFFRRPCCSPHGHFDTSFPSAPSWPNCSRSGSAGQAHFRTSGEEFGYLADLTHSTGFEPKSSTRLLLQTETRRLSTIRTTMTSLTSQKSNARTLDCSVFPQCQKPLFRTFLIVKATAACNGKPLLDREKKEKVL